MDIHEFNVANNPEESIRQRYPATDTWSPNVAVLTNDMHTLVR